MSVCVCERESTKVRVIERESEKATISYSIFVSFRIFYLPTFFIPPPPVLFFAKELKIIIKAEFFSKLPLRRDHLAFRNKVVCRYSQRSMETLFSDVLLEDLPCLNYIL